MRAVVEEPPAPAVRAGALAGVLYGLLEKDPARRWTVETARAVLRDLLVGPLASNAPAHVTDPYAVVRPQPYTPPQAPPATQPSGQLGGQAMIAPGESVTGALRRMRGESEPHHDAGTGRFSAPPAQDGPYGGDWMPAGAPQPAPAGGGKLSDQARRLATRAKGMPRWAQAAVAAGVVLVLVLVVGGLAGWFGGAGGNPNAGASAGASAPASDAPPFPVQPYADAHGIAVNVPASWTKQSASAYTDFIDPTDSTRKIRINGSENAHDADAFFVSAEKRLKNPSTSSCVSPYNRVALRDDITLAGRKGAELEYTCGSGTAQRHALWAAVVINGHAYHFFVTVPEAKFAESKAIYQEMIRSFKVNPT
jgi:hypothetical protein